MDQRESDDRKRVITDHSTSYFVEAGAGAGKTKIVVDRIISQLSSGGYEPSEIAAITFTNAAAAELRGRIIDGLQQKASGSGPECISVKRALGSIDRIMIGTIHSFCFSMLKERAFEIGLRPDVAPLEEDELDADKKAFFDRWYSRNAVMKKELMPLEWAKRGLLYHFFSLLADMPEDVETVYDKALLASCSESQLQAELKKAVLDINAILNVPECMGNLKTPGQAAYDACGECKRLDTGYEACLMKHFDSEKSVKNLFSARSKDQKALAATYTDLVWDIAEPVVKKRTGFRTAVLIETALQAAKDYRAGRNPAQITNNGILEEARNLICSSKNPEAFRYFASRFKCIYVDEFQDTDHIQTELIMKLAQDPEDASRFRKGALFVVGDPKQSIYRFRGADPEIYSLVKEDFLARQAAGQECSIIELPTNFRSSGRIIDWVNQNYQNRIKNYISMEVSPEQLECGRKLEALTGPDKNRILSGVYYINSADECRCSGKKDSAMADIFHDAETCALIIDVLVKNGYCIPDRFNPAGFRKIAYRDFLVLVPTLADMDIYVNRFEQLGINTEIYGRIVLEEDVVISSFYRMYSYLSSGFSDRAAWERAIDLKMLQGISRLEAEKDLSLEKEKVHSMNAFALMDYLLKTPELFLPRSGGSGGLTDSEKTSVRRLRQLFENVIATTPPDKQLVQQKLKTLIAKPLEREMRLDPFADCVRFMNEHKAKGLEGRIVICAKRVEQKLFQSSFRCRDKNGRYKFYLSSEGERLDGKFRLPVYSAYDKAGKEAQEDRENTAAEQTRLEYVTATRAEEVLIFLDPLSQKAQFCYGTGETADEFGRPPYKFDAESGVRSLPACVPELRPREEDTPSQENDSLQQQNDEEQDG